MNEQKEGPSRAATLRGPKSDALASVSNGEYTDQRRPYKDGVADVSTPYGITGVENAK